MSDKRFGVAVVGAGKIGSVHMRNIYKTPVFELRAVVDMDVSKAEAGKLKIQIAECSLAKLLNHVESMMRPQVLEK